MSEWNGRCTTIAPGMVNTPFYDGAFDIECCDENGVTIWLEIFEPSDGDLELLYI